MEAIQKSLSNKITEMMGRSIRPLTTDQISVMLNIDPSRAGQCLRLLEKLGKVAFMGSGTWSLGGVIETSSGDKERIAFSMLVLKIEIDAACIKANEIFMKASEKRRDYSLAAIARKSGLTPFQVKSLRNKIAT